MTMKGEGGRKRMNLSYVLSMAKMAIATFSSRVLGLVREQVMAAMFGASVVTDAFNVAFRIPNVLRDLFAEGVFSSAFVPIFTTVITKDEKKAKELEDWLISQKALGPRRKQWVEKEAKVES